jgi:hypothetical protein
MTAFVRCDISSKWDGGILWEYGSKLRRRAQASVILSTGPRRNKAIYRTVNEVRAKFVIVIGTEAPQRWKRDSRAKD